LEHVGTFSIFRWRCYKSSLKILNEYKFFFPHNQKKRALLVCRAHPF
jgi:hypothetical protein